MTASASGRKTDGRDRLRAYFGFAKMRRRRRNGLRRSSACALAKDAAPYIHPRLAVTASVRQITNIRDLSGSELVALIRSLGGGMIDGEAEPLALPAGGRDLD